MNETETIESKIKLLTRRSAAYQIHCCIRTLDKHIQSGALPTVRLGRRRLIREQDLETFINSLTAREARDK